MVWAHASDTALQKTVVRIMLVACSYTSCSKTRVPIMIFQCVPTTACQTNDPMTFLALAPPTAFRKASSHSDFGTCFRHSLATNGSSHSVLCMCPYTSCSKTSVPTMVFQYVTTIACQTTSAPMTFSSPRHKQRATSNPHRTNGFKEEIANSRP